MTIETEYGKRFPMWNLAACSQDPVRRLFNDIDPDISVVEGFRQMLLTASERNKAPIRGILRELNAHLKKSEKS